jgi:hypothetical protein
VAFGTTLPMKDGNPDRKPLGNAMREFADLIWKIGGFRFGHRRTHWDKMKFIYYCCQCNIYMLQNKFSSEGKKTKHKCDILYMQTSKLVFK